jgi:NAD(P)-dependent dehydrogenase (short-subunit alcohol dehydrogenase family)
MTKPNVNVSSYLSVHPGELAGQVALVTGGGRGIGRATAQALATAGATVVITSRSQGELDQTLTLIAQSGGHGYSVVTDVTNQSAVEQAVQQTEAQWGPIDLLINNAATAAGLGKIVDIDPKQWWLDVETSVRGSLLTTHAVLPGMIARQRGRIINVASRQGIVPLALASSYTVAKTAIIRFTEVLSLEVRDQGISTFAIHPGTVPTSLTPHSNSGNDDFQYLPESFFEMFKRASVDSPELGANLITFLATGKADVLSGCYINAHDDLLAMIADAETTQHNDLYKLRLSL